MMGLEDETEVATRPAKGFARLAPRPRAAASLIFPMNEIFWGDDFVVRGPAPAF